MARIDYGMAEWTETMLRDVARQRPGGNVYKVKRGTQPASTKSPARSHDGHPIREEIWAEKIVNGNPQVVVKLQVVAKLVAAMTMSGEHHFDAHGLRNQLHLRVEEQLDPLVERFAQRIAATANTARCRLVEMALPG